MPDFIDVYCPKPEYLTSLHPDHLEDLAADVAENLSTLELKVSRLREYFNKLQQVRQDRGLL